MAETRSYKGVLSYSVNCLPLRAIVASLVCFAIAAAIILVAVSPCIALRVFYRQALSFTSRRRSLAMIPIFVAFIISGCGLIGVAYAPGYRPGRVVRCTPLEDSEINTLMGFILSVPIIVGLIFTVRQLRKAALPPYTPRPEVTEALPDYQLNSQHPATESSPAYDRHAETAEIIELTPAAVSATTTPAEPPPAYNDSGPAPIDQTRVQESEV